MSIINDAIKKARREFELKNKTAAVCVIHEEKKPENQQSSPSEVKWTLAVVASLVLIISLLGSIVLYRHASRVDIDYNPGTQSVKSEKLRPSFNFSIPNQKNTAPGTSIKDAIKLNGIVYGPEGKWAIINNKIVREGDSLLNGEVTVIAKDFVKIEKDDGEEIILDLK